jgi:hypothetical protein
MLVRRIIGVSPVEALDGLLLRVTTEGPGSLNLTRFLGLPLVCGIEDIFKHEGCCDMAVSCLTMFAAGGCSRWPLRVRLSAMGRLRSSDMTKRMHERYSIQ